MLSISFMLLISLLSSTFLTAIARAAELQAEIAANNNPILSMLPLVVIFVVFYFLMIRPQQKRAREFATMLDSLTVGDKVATAGGVIGQIVSMDKEKGTVELKVNSTSSILIYRKAITEILESKKAIVHERKPKAIS